MVDDSALEVVREEVADDPQRQLRLLVDERRRLGLSARPWISFQSRWRKSMSRSMSSADAPSAAVRTIMLPGLRRDRLQDVPEAGALLLGQPARDAEALAARHVDDEPARQRDLGRQPGALRLHRVLDGLDEDLLAAAQQVLDLAAVPAPLELGGDDLVDVEEAVLLEADLDERRLHPRQDVVDGPLVDVPRDRAALGPLEVDLGDLVVLEHRRRAARRRRRR